MDILKTVTDVALVAKTETVFTADHVFYTNVHDGGCPVDKVVDFGREIRGFEFSNRRSTSPTDSPLLSTAPFDVQCDVININ